MVSAVSLIPAFELGLWNAWILVVLIFLFQALGIPLLGKTLKKRDIPFAAPLTSQERKLHNTVNALIFLQAAYSIFVPLDTGVWLYAGLVLFVIGTALLVAVVVPWRTAPPGKPITSGLYRYSRHPIYLTLFLRFVGVGIAGISWLMLLLSTITIVLVLRLVVSEERFCLQRFGDEYREYMERTPKLIGIPKRR